MLIAKQQILRLIKDLPDKVDIDEVMYRLYLRQKLEADPTQPQYLLTESGVGYRLKG